MVPKRKINPKKLMGKSRVTPLVRWVSMKIPGTGMHKVSKIAEKVLLQLTYDPYSIQKRKNILKRDANANLKKPRTVNFLHCTDRCNLAIALMRASGTKTWLAREMHFDLMSKKYEFHDYVEFFMNGKVHTLVFGEKLGAGAYYDIAEGPAHKNYGDLMSQVFRGADAEQIGGAINYGKYKAFAKNLDKNPLKQSQKEERRFALLVESGIIPKEAVEQIRN